MNSKLLSITKVSVLFLLSVFVLSSCEGPMGPQGPAGRDGFANMQTITFTIRGADWIWDSQNELYYYDFDTPRMTQKIVDDGLVAAYRLIDGEYYLLNSIGHFYDETNQVFFGQQATLRYKEGRIGFIVSRSDLFDNLPLNQTPETYDIKVVMLW